MGSVDDEFTAYAESASGRLLGTAFLLCGNWHTAEDLTQATLAKVFAAWRRISSRDAVQAYTRRTLLNTYFVDCRRKRRGEVLTPDPAVLTGPVVPPPAPELRLELMAALAELPPRARAVVVLRYWEDMSVDQVAALLGCSPGNVKSQSSRALAKLRLLLGDTGTGTPPRMTEDRGDSREVRNG